MTVGFHFVVNQGTMGINPLKFGNPNSTSASRTPSVLKIPPLNENIAPRPHPSIAINILHPNGNEKIASHPHPNMTITRVRF